MVHDARIDLHTHSSLSDGDLLPGEMPRHVELLGYDAPAITGHADASNPDRLDANLLCFARDGAGESGVRFVPGVELTQIPPPQIAGLARRAQELGALLVAVHGESPVEQVASGTNRAAIQCPEVDMLAHPGFADEEDAALAAANGTCLELTSKGGHCLSDCQVAGIVLLTGARLLVNTDTHRPHDMMGQADVGAGLGEDEVEVALVTHARELLATALER